VEPLIASTPKFASTPKKKKKKKKKNLLALQKKKKNSTPIFRQVTAQYPQKKFSDTLNINCLASPLREEEC
jgi:hypothetical protein